MSELTEEEKNEIDSLERDIYPKHPYENPDLEMHRKVLRHSFRGSVLNYGVRAYCTYHLFNAAKHAYINNEPIQKFAKRYEVIKIGKWLSFTPPCYCK